MHVLGLAAHVGGVGFAGTVELVDALNLHRGPNPVQHEPSGGLGDANVAGDFVAAHSVLAVGDQPDGQEPFVERNLARLKHGAQAAAELLPAVFAAEHPASLDLANADALG